MNYVDAKIEELFNGTLGTYKTDPVYFGWKENYKPIFSILYKVTKVHR